MQKQFRILQRKYGKTWSDKAAGSTDAEFADYIKNITSVSVNGKSYAASGRGAVKLFNDDGTLITDAAPFAEGDSFEIVVTATGYKDLSFTYKKASSDAPTQEVNTFFSGKSNPECRNTERSRLHRRQLESSAGSTEKCEECTGS